MPRSRPDTKPWKPTERRRRFGSCGIRSSSAGPICPITEERRGERFTDRAGIGSLRKKERETMELEEKKNVKNEREHNLFRCTYVEVREWLKDTGIVLIPLGSTEQH